MQTCATSRCAALFTIAILFVTVVVSSATLGNLRSNSQLRSSYAHLNSCFVQANSPNANRNASFAHMFNPKHKARHCRMHVVEPVLQCRETYAYQSVRQRNFVGQDHEAARVHTADFLQMLLHYCRQEKDRNPEVMTDVEAFFCALYFPPCSDQPIVPCRQLCETVLRECQRAIRLLSYVWPAQLHCSNFPQLHVHQASTTTDVYSTSTSTTSTSTTSTSTTSTSTTSTSTTSTTSTSTSPTSTSTTSTSTTSRSTSAVRQQTRKFFTRLSTTSNVTKTPIFRKRLTTDSRTSRSTQVDNYGNYSKSESVNSKKSVRNASVDATVQLENVTVDKRERVKTSSSTSSTLTSQQVTSTIAVSSYNSSTSTSTSSDNKHSVVGLLNASQIISTHGTSSTTAIGSVSQNNSLSTLSVNVVTNRPTWISMPSENETLLQPSDSETDALDSAFDNEAIVPTDVSLVATKQVTMALLANDPLSSQNDEATETETEAIEERKQLSRAAERADLLQKEEETAEVVNQAKISLDRPSSCSNTNHKNLLAFHSALASLSLLLSGYR